MILRLTGKVLVDGSPVEGSYIRINGPSGNFVWEARTEADGEFGFNLPPGEWTLIAFAPGAERQTQTFNLSEDSTEVVIDLRAS